MTNLFWIAPLVDAAILFWIAKKHIKFLAIYLMVGWVILDTIDLLNLYLDNAQFKNILSQFVMIFVEIWIVVKLYFILKKSKLK